MLLNKSKPCRICGDPTPAVVNIKFTAVPLCESCCGAIFIQQAQWYVQQDYSHLYKPELTPEEKAVMDVLDDNIEVHQVQTPIAGSKKGYSGKFLFIKFSGKRKTMTELPDNKSPNITIRIIKSLIKRGLIREYCSTTHAYGVIHTYYKKS